MKELHFESKVVNIYNKEEYFWHLTRLCRSAKNSQCRVFLILLNPAAPHVFRTMQRWLFAHTRNLNLLMCLQI